MSQDSNEQDPVRRAERLESPQATDQIREGRSMGSSYRIAPSLESILAFYFVSLSRCRKKDVMLVVFRQVLNEALPQPRSALEILLERRS